MSGPSPILDMFDNIKNIDNTKNIGNTLNTEYIDNIDVVSHSL